MPFRHRSFQFVASDVNGLPQNRKKAQRACMNCRKRKRRCTHGSQRPQVSGDTQTRVILSPPVNEEEEPTNIPGSSEVNEHQNAQAPPQGACIDGESWFVGDLDPEGAFLVAASPSSSSRSMRRHGDVGVWLSARNAYSQLAVKKPRSSLMSCLDPLLSSVFLPYLEHQCLGALPAPNDMKELLKIYLENVQPMFPVLDYESYQILSDTSPEKILLSQSICIATSIDRGAKEYLRLPTTR
ncbi:uncharacterized protein N7483_009365 [Penicillium malachiteum]|uniref:uncharacterized protein n=1 Tax=Penicillium malachiteum TaxID=1324776 RepID=UPI002548395F|nr:uncharacterized protein N7483_009365 [Penicillium malachiteum]KAJ5721431.1 hypothetical protein N7483_009365 [Penicillium malachiteum]